MGIIRTDLEQAILESPMLKDIKDNIFKESALSKWIKKENKMSNDKKTKENDVEEKKIENRELTPWEKSVDKTVKVIISLEGFQKEICQDFGVESCNDLIGAIPAFVGKVEAYAYREKAMAVKALHDSFDAVKKAAKRVSDIAENEIKFKEDQEAKRLAGL